jgi:hypothetical protein
MTSASTAASNGSATAPDTPAVVPARGLARLREEQCYHLTALIRSALDQAEYLTNEVNDRAMHRYTDYSGDKGTTPLDRDYARERLGEARTCAQVAVDYLFRAISALHDEDGEDLPF